LLPGKICRSSVDPAEGLPCVDPGAPPDWPIHGPALLPGNNRHECGCESRDRVLHALQDESMQIANIAWHENRGDLTCSLGQQLVATGPAVKNNEGGVRGDHPPVSNLCVLGPSGADRRLPRAERRPL
jgi:hypothetical protein